MFSVLETLNSVLIDQGHFDRNSHYYGVYEIFSSHLEMQYINRQLVFLSNANLNHKYLVLQSDTLGFSSTELGLLSLGLFGHTVFELQS